MWWRLALVLTVCAGCAPVQAPGDRDRILFWSAGMPACLLICTVQIEVTNAEGNTARTNGDVQQNRTLTAGSQSIREDIRAGAPSPRGVAPLP